ncbi:MAG: AMP-binding protein [Flavobacteriaceae bacterium]
MYLKNLVHKTFKLNGNSFSNEEELITFSKTISASLYRFLTDWFSNEDFIVVNTSGSTGNPKEIQLKKEYMKNSAIATGDYFELYPETTALCCLPIDFIAGKMMVVRAMILGWDLDIVAPSSNPLESIEKRYDFSAMVPLQLSNSLDDMHKVYTLIVGGGVVSNELQESLQSLSSHVYATYGMTETITHIAVQQLNIFPHSPVPSKEQIERYQSHYEVLPNVSISTDKRGCLIINAPKVSGEKVITNDVVEIISEGEFIWKGRYDNVINSGGIKLHPEEIEQKLSSVIEQRFFVIGMPDEKLGEKLVLIIEGEEYPLSDTTFHKLSKFQTPKDIYFVTDFIETITGKIQRKETLKRISLS